MLLHNQQKFHRIFFEFCIYQGNILLKKDINKKLCHIFIELNIGQEKNEISSFFYLLAAL